MRSTVASVVASFFLLIPLAHATSTHDEVNLDAAGLQQLEQRAEHAESREQTFLYTELVQFYTQVAGRQVADGDMDHASATLKQIDHLVSLIHTGLAKNARKLKDAEMMMHTATYRLTQCLHAAAGEDQPAIASTLRQLDKVHEELLAQVFAH